MAISNVRTAFLANPYGEIKLDVTAVTALGLVSTADDIRTVLGFLNDCVARNRVTTVDSTGYATSVEN